MLRLRSLMLLLAAILAMPLAAKSAKDDGADQPYGALAFRSLGPLVGGRIARVAGVPGSAIFYAAAAQGGGGEGNPRRTLRILRRANQTTTIAAG